MSNYKGYLFNQDDVMIVNTSGHITFVPKEQIKRISLSIDKPSLDRTEEQKLIIKIRHLLQKVLVIKNNDNVYKPIKNTSKNEVYELVYLLEELLKAHNYNLEDEDFLKELEKNKNELS